MQTPLINALRLRAIKHEQDQREPVRARIREQVAALTASMTTKSQNVSTRNREAFVAAVANTKRPGEVYAGTVSAKTIAHRRARGRMAKASRKANRHG
jgi:hypothetical protein